MNDFLDQLKGEINLDALQDQTVAKAGYEYKIPDKGATLARFVGYIELGKHPEFFNGKEKEHPAPYAKLVFELLGAKHITTDEDGNKRSTMYYQDVTIKTDEKAKFRKLFMKMRGGREDVKHMAQMLGEGFIIKIVHNTVGEGKDQKTYANIYDSGEWLVFPPVKEDPLSGEVEVIEVPPMMATPQLFLFDNPTKTQWDSIFIDGEYTTKDDKGNETTRSKNFIQRRIMEAKNFEGSAVEDMLSGLGELDLTDDTDASEPEKQEDKPEDKPKEPVKEEPKEEVKEPAKTEADVDDVFAELGIHV